MNTQINLKKTVLRLCLAGFAAGILAGCASTNVTNQEQLVTGPIPRPGNIWVYDFAATPNDLPANSTLANRPDVDTTPQTDEDIAEGRKLGAQIATQLVEQIRALGMPAEVASAGTQPQLNDLVIRGYLVSVREGNAAKRVAIGFGSGASEMKTAVEGFEMTATGLRKLGFGTVNAGGGKSPGAGVGLAGLLVTGNPAGLIVSGGMHVYGEESGSSTVEGRAKATAKEIADQLKVRFQEQGWIN
ncbi:MAG: DUF4410 domain-containing protein [Verrucomicrobiota bacterium]